MILVNLPSSWPRVVAGTATAEEVTLRAWASVNDEALDQYADAVLGIYKNEVVSAFDVTGWNRIASGPEEGRVEFDGEVSARWGHLIGTPNPGKPWRRGHARPVQYLDTAVLLSGEVPVEEDGETSARRAVVGEYILTVDQDGSANVVIPSGGRLSVTTK